MHRFLILLIFSGLISCTHNFDILPLAVNTLQAGIFQNPNKQLFSGNYEIVEGSYA